MKKLVILGSTGSIGTQTLDIVRIFPERFQVVGLSCARNLEVLCEQIKEFRPRMVGVADEEEAEMKLPIAIARGMEGLCSLAALPDADLVVNGLVGSVGVKPTLAAIYAGKNIALANKEALVSEGERIMTAARFHNVRVLPVDSEHSAIFQCLEGRKMGDVEKIVLTCSGGPFRGFSREQLRNVTKEESLKHPTWKMGAKISVDCATLVNKGLEVIEAMHLFNLRPEQIEVVIHPQSQVHGIVYFKDGTVLLAASANDMRIPIAYALHYPEKVPNQLPRLALPALSAISVGNSWTFEKPDMDTFEGLKIAYEAAGKGGDFPKIFNEANEKAVAAFLRDEIGFLDIYARLKSAIGVL